MEGFRLSEEDERKIKALSREPGIAKRVQSQLTKTNHRSSIPSRQVSTATKISKLQSHCPFSAVYPKTSVENTRSAETSMSSSLVTQVQLNPKSSNTSRRPRIAQSLLLVKAHQPLVLQPVYTKTRLRANGHSKAARSFSQTKELV